MNSDLSTKLVDTSSRTGVIGFIVAIKSLKGIYHNFIEKHKLKFILSYKFSQDHLETMFSIIRSKNDAPNTKQFRSVIKRLMVHNELNGSISGNCVDWGDTVFLHGNPNLAQINASSIVRSNLDGYDSSEVVDDDPEEIDFLPLNNYICDVVIYIAGFVQRNILKRLKCDICKNAIAEDDVWFGEIICIKNRGN